MIAVRSNHCGQIAGEIRDKGRTTVRIDTHSRRRTNSGKVDTEILKPTSHFDPPFRQTIPTNHSNFLDRFCSPDKMAPVAFAPVPNATGDF